MSILRQLTWSSAWGSCRYYLRLVTVVGAGLAQGIRRVVDRCSQTDMLCAMTRAMAQSTPSLYGNPSTAALKTSSCSLSAIIRKCVAHGGD